MGTGRIAFAAAAMLWLALPALAAPSEADAAGGKLLADGAELTLETSGAAADSIDRVGGGGFVAISWRPGTLGDPDALIEQAVIEAVDRGHRRVTAADLEADPDGHLTLAQLDSGWDDFGALTPEHQLRRLRQLANLLTERAPASERLLELEARVAAPGVATTVGRSDEGLFTRSLKDALKSLQNGTFFTPERIAIAVAFLLAVATLTRLRHLRGR
jgi:hypothetical protein